MKNKFLLLSLTAFLFLTQAAFAFVNPDEQLADPALESRARIISKDIRCPVCEGQTIDESNADLARDLRILIRERLTAGDSDEDVVEYLRLRYGDAILMNPQLNKSTALLWFGPFVVFALGGAAAFAMLRKAQKS